MLSQLTVFFICPARMCLSCISNSVRYGTDLSKVLCTLKSKSSTQYLGVRHTCAVVLTAKCKKPALATQQKFVALSTSCQPTDHWQNWAVDGINNFCCCCTLALTVGPKWILCLTLLLAIFLELHPSLLLHLDIKSELQALSNSARWA